MTHEEKLQTLLKKLYKTQSPTEIKRLSSQMLQTLGQRSGDKDNSGRNKRWDAGSSVLITYADTIIEEGVPGLVSLRKVLDEEVKELSSIVHVLPFLKSTSDGGFAVSSYEHLDTRYGNWDDLAMLGKNRKVMSDLVLNHISAAHPWVRQFLENKEPGKSCVLQGSPGTCWNNVVRPRSSALFTQLSGESGPRKVWTTFGPDQVDLNWKNSNVLIGFTELLRKLCDNGVRWLRLDAVGFIWKEPNTNCIHLPEAHLIVEILKLMLDFCFEDGVIVTETNVPQKENLSYLRSGKEAHLAYNFPLPPLLLEATISGRADLLNAWLLQWPTLPKDTGLLNFTSCHDGVGLRPLEGLMPDKRLLQLLINCELRGGLISHRRISQEKDIPYEINISWWSAMADGGIDPSYQQRDRFLMTQFLIMALPGIPAFYLPSLLASPNDLGRFRRSGQRRDLNRPQFKYSSIKRILSDPDSEPSEVLKILRFGIITRSTLSAFDPDSPMMLLSESRSDLVIIQRGLGKNKIFAIHNLTNSRLSLDLRFLTNSPSTSVWKDYISDTSIPLGKLQLVLNPYAYHWLGES